MDCGHGVDVKFSVRRADDDLASPVSFVNYNMNFSDTFLEQLRQLLQGARINYGAFQGTSRKLVDLFLTDGALDYLPAGVQRKKVFCHDAAELRSYLHNKYGITSLEAYVHLRQQEEVDRSLSVRVASNSKDHDGRIFQGFFINTYADVTGDLNGAALALKGHAGAHQFIYDYRQFSIPPHVTIVVVEGYQNFRDIDQQQYLFQDIQPLFIWRYQNMKAVTEWLNLHSNPVLHFGDFDLAGLKIYVTEFRNKLTPGRCRYFFPPNLESLMKKFGNRSLYDRQLQYVKNIDFSLYPEVQLPLEIIRRNKKGLEQEILIGKAATDHLILE